MGRRIWNFLFFATLLAVLSSTALAVSDVEYSGLLDPQTGLPMDSRESSDVTYVELSDGVFGYDRRQNCFLNNVGDRSFTSSIPNGAILTAGRHDASFSVPAGLSAVLYRNGEALPDADLSYIADAGSYVLEVSAGSGDRVTFSFRLLAGEVNNLSEFSLPAGFTFDTVLLNGEVLTVDYSNYAELLEDGSYNITWSCANIGKSYTTAFRLDTVAPTLSLPEVTNGQAHSAVTIADLESGAKVRLENRDTGEAQIISSADVEITEAGTYRLTVYDTAGNSTVYDFTIHFYLNISAAAALILLLAAILGLWGYSRYIHTHPRVG